MEEKERIRYKGRAFRVFKPRTPADIWQISIMARFRFAVEYFGAPFAGWQLQDNAVTVQGELERALATALRQPLRITGAGRTDAGVHASGQVAHFDFEGEIDAERLTRSVNALTGPHIQIRRMESCPSGFHGFHARYSATSRRYLYRIALRPMALMRELSWHPGFAMDADLFQSELRTALGDNDFVNFSVPRDDGKSTRCHLIRADAVREEDMLLVRIEANRFLHKMVRSLVGASFDVARSIHPPGLIQAVLQGEFQGTRMWAPPQGLCLEKVAYPDYDV